MLQPQPPKQKYQFIHGTVLAYCCYGQTRGKKQITVKSEVKPHPRYPTDQSGPTWVTTELESVSSVSNQMETPQ